ncbi:MAG: SDR family NAD(P)-dependent oxidoreductase, partial [Catalinimonas sp.]
MEPLKGQVALVTGGSSGIGEAVVYALAAAGAHVGINYHSGDEAAERIAADVRAQHGVRALTLPGNVSKEADVKRMFERMDELGPLDILVANAGVQKDAPFLELTVEDWRQVIEVNLTGQFLCAQAAARRFCAQGVR